MFCKFCGCEIKEQDAFCARCGAKLKNDNFNISKNYEQDSINNIEKADEGNKTLLILGIIFPLCSWLFFGVSFAVAAIILNSIGIGLSIPAVVFNARNLTSKKYLAPSIVFFILSILSVVGCFILLCYMFSFL